MSGVWSAARYLKLTTSTVHRYMMRRSSKNKVPKENVAARPSVKSGPPQSSVFEQAMELFNARNFQEAMQLFEAATSGPSKEVSCAARLHVRMCEQRLGLKSHVPKSAEDHYNLAIALINRRDLPEARVHLEAALKTTPQGGHLHYALALLNGLEGSYAASARALAYAIELDAGNRTAARNDPDFRDILRRPELKAVLESHEAPTA